MKFTSRHYTNWLQEHIIHVYIILMMRTGAFVRNNDFWYSMLAASSAAVCGQGAAQGSDRRAAHDARPPVPRAEGEEEGEGGGPQQAGSQVSH